MLKKQYFDLRLNYSQKDVWKKLRIREASDNAIFQKFSRTEAHDLKSEQILT